MKYRSSCGAFAFSAAIATALLLLLPAFGADAADRRHSTDRLIVRLADWADADRAQPMSTDRARALSVVARTRLDPMRRMSGGAHVVRLTHDMALADVEAMAERLMMDPAVVHAEPDRRKFPMLAATDPLYTNQWSLFEPVGGINAPLAWDVTTGSPMVVVAILDTGILPANVDLVGRLVAGYDFVREDSAGVFLTANDGDGRDPDPSDPGNWITMAEAGQGPFTDCKQPENSTWHGTHTAGIIAASANNGYGIAGIAWSVRVLPVRVLGKCGGYTSDIIDAIRWSAGIAVTGAPANANPAQVLNLSLGSPGPCGAEEQAAIDDALATGRVRAIVTAAGNEGGDSTVVAPGNCADVITVTATDRSGSRAPYASTGANVTVAAPGGFFPMGATSGANGILSLFNTGTTTPVADSFAFAAGTSEAAAHVSGVVALMLSVNPGLSAADVQATLRGTARAFPDATCSMSTCGTGIVNAAAAVMASTMPAESSMPVSMPTAGMSSGMSGGGGGGCTIARGGAPDLALPLLALWAVFAIARRARNGRRSPRTPRA